ncbi:MAG: hypothetical protein ACKVWR_11915 [Acidimicrobiales bacterium]
MANSETRNYGRTEAGDRVSTGTTMRDRPTGMEEATGALAYTEPTVVDSDPLRLRWGAIWAGLVVALATFLLLQLILFATEAIDFDVDPTGEAGDAQVWTAIAGVVALLLGGIVAGVGARRGHMDAAALHGVVLWGATIVVLLVASSVAAGALAGALGDLTGRLSYIIDQAGATGFNQAEAVDQARDVAGAATAFVVLGLVATVVGALIGATANRPRREALDGRS